MVGGIASINYYIINYSYDSGALAIVSNGYTAQPMKLGGIAGINTTDTYSGLAGSISTCYVDLQNGKISSTNSSGNASLIGGLVGNNTVTTTGVISNCYSIVGSVNVSGSTTDAVSLLVGLTNVINGAYYNIFNNCYFYTSGDTTRLLTYNTASSTTSIYTTNSNSNWAGKIIAVGNLNDGASTVNIIGMTILVSNDFIPRFAWQS